MARRKIQGLPGGAPRPQDDTMGPQDAGLEVVPTVISAPPETEALKKRRKSLPSGLDL